MNTPLENYRWTLFTDKQLKNLSNALTYWMESPESFDTESEEEMRNQIDSELERR